MTPNSASFVPPPGLPMPPDLLLPPEVSRESPRAEPLGQPFASAEEAWFWTMSSLKLRREGAVCRSGHGPHRRRVRRPCEPDDVVKCVDTLYRNRRIDLEHARVLRLWGERRVAPGPASRGAQLWREAMERLDWPLRVKGIVA